MARVRKMVEEEIISPPGAVDDAEAQTGAYAYTVPLFEHAGLDPTRVPGGIAVTREDPPDGYIGHFPASTTKEDLKRLVGGYVLSIELKDSNGKLMKGGGQKMLRIDSPPVASASAKAAVEELKKGNGVGTPDQFARILEIQRTAIDEIRTRSNDTLSLMRTELEGAAARRAQDADASIRRMNEEAKIRSDEAEAKHKRELELARTYQESQLQREREQRTLEAKQHTEMIGMIQANSAQQTQLVIASMGSKTDAMGVIKEMMALAIPLLPMLSGQEDPGVAITKAVSTSLESMSKMATNEPANGKEIVRANGAQSNGQQKVGAKPSADAADKKSRLIAKVGALFQAVNAAGHDPEEMLDGAIKHYNAQADADDDDDPNAEAVDDGADDGQTRSHAPKRAKRRAPSRAKSARVAGRAGSKPKPASKPVVGRRTAPHGRSKATGSARSNASGSKRHRKA